MTTWIMIFLCLMPLNQAKDDGIYECGAHGRFEYCIDGIPGCVVGCHCHPGYYFDTETKICEPNTKLTQNYRRYIPEPTQIQNKVNLPEIENTEMPSLTTRNVIDDHVNDITNNADDLGDWLYNQFFKTIENQVINKTKDSQLTRRSGRDSYGKHNKSKRRAKKRNKSRHRKRKGKGMRQKLLQITEDDSLFESSESYESDSDSSSSDFSRSYSSFESDSFEGHGHKKIVMINKKPRPPLPSFIFLPHMNTPFFPPIGLPPPPAMPMYPVVPVPPVMPAPPMLPFPGPGPDCQENTTVITTIPTVITTTITTTTEELPSTTDSDVTPEEAPPDAEEEPSEDVPASRNRNNGRKRKQMKSFQNMPNNNQDSPYKKYKTPRQGRPKLMKNVRQKIYNPRINNPTLKRNKKLLDNYAHMLPDNLIDNINADDVFLKNENSLLGNLPDDPDPDNVDFKYLSQLIHRVNESQNEELPMDFYKPQDSYKALNPSRWSAKKFHDFTLPLQSGRRMIQNLNNPREVQPDDAYYSNLGRQIATLIRTIDVDNERQLKIEIEKVQQKPDNPDPAFFNENAPRTFWERSVRSPLKYFYPYKTRYEYLKNSNELLFNIENKVETAVSTAPTLSLQEIENMISVMQSAQKQFRKNTKLKNIKPSSKTLNINLWPQEIKQSKNSIKSSARSNVLNINKRKFINYSNNTRPEILNAKLIIHNIRTLPDGQVNVPNLKDVSTRDLKMQPVKTAGTNFYFIRNNTTVAHSEHLPKQNALNVQTFEKLTYNINPTANEYRNIKKYFFDDSIHYSFQNDNLPLQYSSVRDISKQAVKPLLPSTYFNDETNPVNFTP